MRPIRTGVLVLLAFAPGLGAQTTPKRTLARPDAEFPESFTQIDGIRELKDGRVLLVDSHDLTVQLLDFAASTNTKIGRNGQGPGEYQWPSRIFAVSGDSTVVWDAAGGRLHLYGPDGRSGGDFDPHLSNEGNAATRAGVTAMDTLGRMFGQSQPVRVAADGSMSLLDSAAIQRWSRTRPGRDTVGYMPVPKDPTRHVAPGGFVFSQPMADPPPYPSTDHWIVGPDGRIAVLRADPYRVGYFDANGALRESPPIPFERVKVSEEHKKLWRAERSKPVMAMVYNRSGPASFRLMSRPVKEPSSWPEYLPPYVSGFIPPGSFASDGTVWVRRTTAANAPPLYDVIDERGRLVEQVALPTATTLVGFGRGTVYLARVDDDDLQYLQRYRLPVPRPHP
jgi:hypothetical protein